MKDQVYSGFVVLKNGSREWIGCGTEDELYGMYTQMQDDCVEDDCCYPGDLEISVASQEEINKFNAECGHKI